MKLITERTQVRDVAARWAQQYSEHGLYEKDAEKQAIGRALKLLDPEVATADDVEAIIGNRSWVKPRTCNECGKDFPVVVEIGEEPDYESPTATLCMMCLQKALALMGSNVADKRPGTQ